MFKYLFIPADSQFSFPKGLGVFKCLILIEREVDDVYRNMVSKQIVEAGCIWSLSWGIDCVLWDD
ncbi:MAG: DUF7684 family protein, partial [Pikeienuella sp.]